jgi:Raf kinase inhibitor-like YbhB/YbcL family protein
MIAPSKTTYRKRHEGLILDLGTEYASKNTTKELAMENTEFAIESTAFKYGEMIPEDYTAHGKNISPPLRWLNVPKHAQELVLICDDPDAPQNAPFVHWILYGILPTITALPEGVTSNSYPALKQGKNSKDTLGFVGPNPPLNTGDHRYYFRLIALDRKLDLKPGASIDEVNVAMLGLILGEAEFMGKHRYHEATHAAS